jgi:hypothetical protein
MAANYWESTQRRHWQFTKPQLAELRQKLEDEEPNLVQSFPLPQIRHLSIYFNLRKFYIPKAYWLKTDLWVSRNIPSREASPD